MNQLTKMFEGQQLRIIEQNNEPWFVAKDVCNILEIKNPTDALKRLDEDERSRFNLGRQGYANAVNEFGLYSLVLGSRKEEAKQFKRWITHEVIPSIRKHGAYATPQTIENIISDPEFGIQLLTNLKEEQEKRIAAEETIQKQKPLVTFAETCMTSEKSLLVRELAKLCTKQGIATGEKRLWQTLRDWKLVFKNKNEPYQEYVDRGYFEISQGVKETQKGAFTWLTMRVKPKGQAYIINRLKKESGEIENAVNG
ncbi:BRO family protein [Virgibacillus sp. M23]|uniref:BRO family protein n=1 Tax=Virgibacillus sp. M23 TaxID=3079030 RepID=UPI002A91F4C1|nr:BRO family protein [Virgibacillus sp. M23]MDY7044393.1 BRO family protein [Virgibacillus sp. M23]